MSVITIYTKPLMSPTLPNMNTNSIKGYLNYDKTVSKLDEKCP